MNTSELEGSGFNNSSTPPLICPGSNDIINRIIIVLYTILLPVVAILNGSLILLIIKSKTLHNRAMYLSLQLAVINLIWGTLNYGTIWITYIVGQWAFGEIGCESNGFILFGTSSARWTIILVLTIDRWLTVYSPFHYPKYAAKVTVALSVIAWSIAILKAIIPLRGILGCYSYSETTGRCDIYCTPILKCVPLIQASTAFDFGTAIVSMCLYVTLFIKAKKLNSSQVVPMEFATRQPRWTKSDKRMAKTIVVLSVTLIVSTLPIVLLDFSFATISRSLQLSSLIYAKYIHGVSRIMVHGVVIADPIVILRNRDVREAFKTQWNKLKNRMEVQVRLLPTSSSKPSKNSTSTESHQ